MLHALVIIWHFQQRGGLKQLDERFKYLISSDKNISRQRPDGLVV